MNTIRASSEHRPWKVTNNDLLLVTCNQASHGASFSLCLPPDTNTVTQPHFLNWKIYCLFTESYWVTVSVPSNCITC